MTVPAVTGTDETANPDETPTDGTTTEEPPADDENQNTDTDTDPAGDTVSADEAIADPIMRQDGIEIATKTQMMNYYIQNASGIPMTLTDGEGIALEIDAETAFPVFYGISLDDFVSMYIEEADAEGVNPAMAFAQAMNDTNFLRFGGELEIGDFVFFKDSSIETEELAYDDIQSGIRAQIQHLKCYASTDDCFYPVVDKQWSDTVRGTLQDISGLGGVWNLDEAYGNSIISMMREMLAMDAGTVHVLQADDAPAA
jgi:hypothetical protein